MMLRSVLKGLGLMFWGIAAAGLLVALVFVGYRVILQYRSALVISEQAAPKERQAASLANSPRPETEETMPGGVAADAPTLLAQSMLSSGAPAKQWPDKTYESAGDPRDQNAACGPLADQQPYVALTLVQRLRLQKALDRLEATRPTTGETFLHLGELYYGFGQFEAAIASLQRALYKGNLRHPEEAYVYLGVSEQALGDFDAARDALARLQTMEEVIPRVRRLWALYAETRLRAGAECRLPSPPAQTAVGGGER